MKKYWVFTAGCFSISLLSAGLFHFLGGTYASLAGSLFASAYMFIPLVSVLLTQLVTGEAPLSGLGIRFKLNRWWLVGLLGMPVFSIAAMFLSALLPGVAIDTDSPAVQQVMRQLTVQGLPTFGPWVVLGIAVVSGLLAACTINALFAFGEEAAWRGFLSRVLNGLGFRKKVLLVGFTWGVWHAPIILMGHNYPSHPVAGVFMMIAFCVLYAPVIQYVRDKSRSVVAAAITHGSLNAVSGINLMYLSGYNDLLCGCCGLAGMVILLVVDVVILIRQ